MLSRFALVTALGMLGCSGGGDNAASREAVPEAGSPEASATRESPGDAAMKTETAEAPIAGVPNMVVIGDLLFGGQPTPEGLEQLAARGYRTVVNTRGENELAWDEQARAEELGMTYVNIPMTKPVTAITDEEVSALAEVMEHAERPMVLHCGSGNRVAGLWAVYLVEHEGVSTEEALKRAARAGMRGVRPVVERRLSGSERH